MSRSWLVGVAFAVTLLGADSASAQEKGLLLRHVSSPAPGRVRIFAAVDPTLTLGPTLTASDFRLMVAAAPAADLSVQRNRSRGGYASITLIDISGSYVAVGGTRMAFATVERYAHTLSFPTDHIGLIRFEAIATAGGLHQDGPAFLAEVRQAAKGRPRGRTNLVAGLREALKQAPQVPGLVEVIVFTDAGDEATNTKAAWDALVDETVHRGIRVSVVTVKDTPADFKAGNKPTVWLDAKNRLQSLAQATHGLFIDGITDPAQLTALLTKSREEAREWLVAEGRLCGVPATGDVDARLEHAPGGGAASGHTKTERFSPQRAPDSTAPCAVPPKPAASPPTCAPTCAAWQACVAGKCEPKPCSGDEQCGADARCGPAKVCVLGGGSLLRKWWFWVAVGAGLLLILGLVLGFRRREEPAVEEPPAPPEPPPPEPVPAPAPQPTPEPVPPTAYVPVPAVGAVLEHLPETHLVAVGGNVTVGERWRLHKRKIQVGGSNDPAAGNDIVFSAPKVSGKHAQFELFPSGDLWVTDLESTNGTFVDGQRLHKNERVKLRVGSQIKLSQQVILEVARPDEQAPTKEPPQDLEDRPAAKPAGAKGRTIFDPGNR